MERLHQCPADVFGPAIVARDVAQPDKVVPGCDLERNIVERRADGLDLLSERAHIACTTASVQVMTAHIGRHPSESALIVERPGQSFSFPEIPFDPRPFCQREESVSKVEANIDGLLPRLAGLGQMGQRRQRLLEATDRLPVG